MAQLGIKYWLETPAGTAYFNVSLADQTTLFSGNYNRLEVVEGLDFPTLRTAIMPRAGIDGALLEPSFRSARYVTLGGVIVASTITQSDLQENDLRKFLNAAVRADCTLRWTRRDGTTRRMSCRLWEAPQMQPRQGTAQKEFRFQLVAADPYVYNDTQDSASDTSVTTASNHTNDGDADSHPVVRVYGNASSAPTAFTLKNNTTGLSVRVTGLAGTDLDTIAEYLEFDMAARTVRHSTGANRIDKLDVASSSFWALQPAVNAIVVEAITGGNPDKFELFWRDAWVGG